MCTSVLIFLATVVLPISCTVNNSTFVATHEWQTIEEGQTLPAGLHVRINLQTGRKEAKLMDESSSNELAKLPEDAASSGDIEPKDHLSSIRERLKEALKNIPAEYLEESDEHVKEIREKYKTYKELKKEFENVNMNIKTDAEIITGLMDEYKNLSKDSSRFLAIIDDLDYLVHQIDNALWFIDSGGLNSIVIPAIVNSTDINIKIKSLRLLGALIHNNPKAQVKALEENSGNYLSHILLVSTNNEEVSAAIYAYGSLLRRFPSAQKENLPKTGTKALVNVFSKGTVELRIRMKALTLICDLMIEQEEVMSSVSAALDDHGSRTKLEQYSSVLLDFWLHEENFCEISQQFISNNYHEISKEADVLEQLLQNMNITANLCLDVWSQSNDLKGAVVFFKNLFYNVKDDEYLIEISQLAEVVFNRLFGKLKFNDEL